MMISTIYITSWQLQCAIELVSLHLMEASCSPGYIRFSVSRVMVLLRICNQVHHDYFHYVNSKPSFRTSVFTITPVQQSSWASNFVWRPIFTWLHEAGMAIVQMFRIDAFVTMHGIGRYFDKSATRKPDTIREDQKHDTNEIEVAILVTHRIRIRAFPQLYSFSTNLLVSLIQNSGAQKRARYGASSYRKEWWNPQPTEYHLVDELVDVVEMLQLPWTGWEWEVPHDDCLLQKQIFHWRCRTRTVWLYDFTIPSITSRFGRHCKIQVGSVMEEAFLWYVSGPSGGGMEGWCYGQYDRKVR